MRWGERDTLKFIKLFLSKKILWDPKVHQYKSKPERHIAFGELIEEFRNATGISINEAEAQKKIKVLKSTYIQEVSKIRKRSCYGYVYKPTMKWFPMWHKCFSRTCRKPVIVDDTDLNNETEMEADEDGSKMWVNEEVEINDIENMSDQDNFLLVLKPEPADNENKDETLQTSYKMKKKKIKRSTSTDNLDRPNTEIIDPELNRKEDEFDIYGKFIATQLRNMNLQKALRLQLEIQSLVSEARISDITEQ